MSGLEENQAKNCGGDGAMSWSGGHSVIGAAAGLAWVGAVIRSPIMPGRPPRKTGACEVATVA